MVTMRRRLIRAASLLLALLMVFAGMHAASAASCIDDDCDKPCCDRDADNQTVIPVLPCCRVSVDQAVPHGASTTIETDRMPLVAPTVAVGESPATLASAQTTHVIPLHLPAPPLYDRNCALLL